MELAQRHDARRRKFAGWTGARLAVDPRPWLNDIVDHLIANPPETVKSAVNVAKPQTYGWGEAFRKENFFTLPAYQHGGRFVGDYLGDPQPAAKVYRPTKTWPSESCYTDPQGICWGEDGCEYEPKMERGSRRNRSGCQQAWSAHSKALFQAFVEAQGGHGSVMFNKSTRCNCARAYQKGHRPYRITGWGRQGDCAGHRLLDHAELARLPSGEMFWVSQPYGVSGMDGLPEGMAMRNLGRERSWYYPQQSKLLVIGDERTLEKLALSYPVPTDTEPVGCVGWDRVLMSG